MALGRPVGSEIRQRIIEILNVIGRGYGYEIHKAYIAIFTPCTRESVYYHLRKGVLLGEFSVESVKTESGEYSWGKTVEKTYYTLGGNAKPKGSVEVEEWAKLNRKPAP